MATAPFGGQNRLVTQQQGGAAHRFLHGAPGIVAQVQDNPLDRRLMLADILQRRGQLRRGFIVEVTDAHIGDVVLQVTAGNGAHPQGFQGNRQIQGFDRAVAHHLQFDGGVRGALEAPGGLLGGQVAHRVPVNLDDMVAGLQTGPGGRSCHR